MKTDAAIPVPPPTRSLPLHDEIARRAYALWEGYGRPDGRDVEIWLEAERQLLGTDAEIAQTPGGAVPAQPLREAVSGGKQARGSRSPATPALTTNTSR